MDELLKYEELYQIASGCVDNYPASCGALAVDSIISEKESKVIGNVFFHDGEYNIYSKLGCVVVTIELPINRKFDVDQAMKILDEWKNNDEKDIVSLQVIPFSLDAEVTLIFQCLVFYDFYLKDNKYKIILAFSNTETLLLVDENANVNSLTARMKEEIRTRENALDEEIYELEDSIKELDEANSYGDSLKNDLQQLTIETEVEEEEIPGVRFSKEEDSEL